MSLCSVKLADCPDEHDGAAGSGAAALLLLLLLLSVSPPALATPAKSCLTGWTVAGGRLS